MVSLSHPVVKISDFGITKQVSDSTELRTTVGTFGYTAPEALGYLSSETSVYTYAVDIWSLGCVVHAIITKETPFPETRKLLDYTQGRILFPRTKLMEKGVSSTAIDFITSLVTAQPENRLTADEALETLWLNTETKVEDTLWTGILDEVPPAGLQLRRDNSTVWTSKNFNIMAYLSLDSEANYGRTT